MRKLTETQKSKIAAVVIGRNEGQRLLLCLTSVKKRIASVVYVDSGSTDGSVALARKLGAYVVILDTSLPFTAARARNAGLAALRSNGLPDFVQFIDGDCELQDGWTNTARQFLESHPRAAVVCGRRRERFPERSVYNRLCNREWDTPVGLTRSCGGDTLMRWTALEQVGGFNPTLIAGEEPELCVRLRSKKWEIWRLDADMTLHDANISRFSQWWMRMRRSGHAAAEGMAMHGAPPERHGVAAVGRAILWGLLLPIIIAVGTIAINPWIMVLLAIYPLQVLRLAIRKGGKWGDWEEACFLTIGKFPETQGILMYLVTRATQKKAMLIEYK